MREVWNKKDDGVYAYDLAIDANNIMPLEESYDDLQISEEDEMQIKELSMDPNIFTKLAENIAPSIYGYEEIKQSIVLQLFGGVKKQRADSTFTRGDIHILLVGDPGVAKSLGKDERILYFSKDQFGYDTLEKLYDRFGKNPENLKILSLDMKSHNSKWSNVKQIIKHSPEKNLIKVTTEHGKQVIATMDHSFITLSEKGDIIPVKGDELDENSYLPIPINFHREFIDELDTDKFNTYLTNSRQLPKKIKLDKDFGFFIGIFLSEGYIRAGNTVSISNKNLAIKKRVKKFAEKIGFNVRDNKKEIYICSKSLSNLLKFYCYGDKLNFVKKVKGNYSRIKKVPSFAYFSPRNFVKEIISGVFSGDGRLIKDNKRLKGFELISVSEKLAQDTSDLLFSLGILNRVLKREYKYKNRVTPYYILSVSTPLVSKFIKNFKFYGRKIMKLHKPIYSYHDCIPCGELVYSLTKKLGYNQRINGDRVFAAEMRAVKSRNKIGRLRLRRILKRFQKRAKENYEEFNILKKIAYSPVVWSKIESIEKVNEKHQEVYDLYIPGTNTFVSNGLAVHNSVILGFIARIAPKGRYVVGKSTSGAGLTATVVRDEFLRGWSLEAGAMVLSHKGIVCIDELEKMDEQDRSSMHEAMEQQCMLPDFKLMLANGESVRIGEFVDNLIEKNKNRVHKGIDCEILPVENVNLLSTDFNNHFSVSASRISRHLAPKEFVKIELNNGREIIVTPEHPCWVINDSKIKTIPAEKMKEGMYFPIPSKIKINAKDYSEKNDLLCKILGYHLSDGCYELNRGKKTGIQFWNNDKNLIKDYQNAIEKYFKIKPVITKRDNQFAVRVISKKVTEEFNKLDKCLLEKGNIKKIPEMIMRLPDKNIKYLLRALYDGDGSVSFQERNGCRISFVSQNRELVEQVSDLLLRFEVQSSIFWDEHSKVWRLDISGQENLSSFLLNVSFLSEHKKDKLKEYCSLKKTYRTIRDVIPGCTDKINEIFKKLNISARKEIGHSIDLHVEKQRLFLQKLVVVAEKKLNLILEKNPALETDYLGIAEEIENIKKIAFGYAQWVKVKSVSNVKNKNIKWVYDVTMEPHHTFISNGMILHNTVTISKANVQASLRAETSVLAAGNPKFGRFDPYLPIAQQVDIQPTLLNRFDVIFMLRDLPERGKDEAIATHVLSEHKNPTFVGTIEPELFRKYIAYAKQKVIPDLTDEAIQEIKHFYITLRNAQTSSDSVVKPIPITARQLNALVRLAEASAKTRLSDKVEKSDAERAINIMKYYLMQTGYDYETKSFDIDKIVTGVTASKRGKIIEVRDAISRLEGKIGKLIPLEELEKELEGKVNKLEIDEALEKLSISGDIFSPKKGFVQRV